MYKAPSGYNPAYDFKSLVNHSQPPVIPYHKPIRTRSNKSVTLKTTTKLTPKLPIKYGIRLPTELVDIIILSLLDFENNYIIPEDILLISDLQKYKLTSSYIPYKTNLILPWTEYVIAKNIWNNDAIDVWNAFLTPKTLFIPQDIDKQLYNQPHDIALPMIKYLINTGRKCTSVIADHAALNGDVELFKYLHSNNIQCTKDAWINAAENGHIDILTFIYGKMRMFNGIEAMVKACTNGHLEVVQFLLYIGQAPKSRAIEAAVTYGHLDIVKLLNSKGCLLPHNIINKAAAGGHMSTLKYLVSINAGSTTLAMDLACANGYLEVVKYLHSIGKKCSDNAMEHACRNAGMIKLRDTKYGKRDRMSKPTRFGEQITETWHPKYDAEASEAIGEDGYLEIIKFLYSIGKRISNITLYEACRNGFIKIVKFIHSTGKRFDGIEIDQAMQGSVPVIEFLHSLGQTCRKNDIIVAVVCNNATILKYLHSKGYLPTGRNKYMDIAISFVCLESIKYLHSIGCKCTTFLGWCNSINPHTRYDDEKFLDMMIYLVRGLKLEIPTTTINGVLKVLDGAGKLNEYNGLNPEIENCSYYQRLFKQFLRDRVVQMRKYKQHWDTLRIRYGKELRGRMFMRMKHQRAEKELAYQRARKSDADNDGETSSKAVRRYDDGRELEGYDDNDRKQWTYPDESQGDYRVVNQFGWYDDEEDER